MQIGRITRGDGLLTMIALVAFSAAAESQPRSETGEGCGAEICLQSGESNWQFDASNYCESDVCLRDSLTGLAMLDWDDLDSGEDSLTSAETNPYVGLTDVEYQSVRELSRLGDDAIEDLALLLGKIEVACRPMEVTLSLNVPGRDIVLVTFGTPAAGEFSQNFQVVSIERTYRSLPGGSMGWWIRWISWRFPGIDLIDGEPTGFANYSIGAFVARLLLLDTEFRFSPAADYGEHTMCSTRSG